VSKSNIQSKTVFGLEQVEAEIYQLDEAFFPDLATRKSVQAVMLRSAFECHYERNVLYRRFCQARGISIETVAQDPRRIPLIPSTTFKQAAVRSNSNEKTVLRCTSSGTQGSVSVVERDNTTLERFLGTIRNAVENVFGIDDAIVLNLGPPSDEEPDLWFSYVMNVTDFLFETRNYVHGGVLMAERFVEDLVAATGQYQDVLVIGAPIVFLELFEQLGRFKLKNCDFGAKLFLVTAGGWKRHERVGIPRDEFRDRCIQAFTGLVPQKIRDTFNMVELNTIIPECECHQKHVPVWLDVFAVDLDNYSVAAPGKVGLLAFLDASASSYPGFVLSGDLGRISHVDDCPCGRPGICVEIVRRINTIESRGCALKIAKVINENQGEAV
jgi:long-chain-fatty-acid---luciferin-component ligase